MDFKRKEKTIEFLDSDGAKIGSCTVATPRLLEEGRLDDFQKAAALKNQQELEAKGEGASLTEEEDKRQYFRLSIYPKLAACSSGDYPDEDTAFDMPASEFYKWYQAVKDVAPDWFEIFDRIAEAYRLSTAEGSEEKKGLEPSQSDSLTS